MTIEEFDNKSWGAGSTIGYRGFERAVVSVDFQEKLIAFAPYVDEQLTWVRCENAEIIES